MKQVYNFNPGPAMLPIAVMQQAQKELLNWHDLGMSVMEVSHRGKEFKQLAAQSAQDLRDLLHVPQNYHILFLQGGARSQFAMVPMNLLNGAKKAAYLRTGIWSDLAYEEAKIYCQADLVVDNKSQNYLDIPEQSCWNNSQDAAFWHYCDNETIHGVEFPYVPDSGKVPLVADMSSNILSRPIDIKKFGLIYACAQKNLGPAGVTIVIIRDDLLERTPLAATPSMFRYKLHAENDSLYNTAPTYAWYIVSLVLQWVKQQGGVEKLAVVNQRKAEKLYQYIDQNDFYVNRVAIPYRSRMNVTFNLPSPELEEKFIRAAEKADLVGLAGHRSLGGIRASIYNAMPQAGVDKLLQFMDDFKQQ